MKKYADLLIKSMIEHDPSILPLASEYTATENSRPGALRGFSLYRTVTGLHYIAQYMEDKTAGQLFFTAHLDESGMSSVFWGRMKITNDDTVSELEFYVNRSIADGGFVFLPDTMNSLPPGWTSDIPEGGRASREQLLALGQAIFDSRTGVEFTASDNCVLMEAGGVVFEDAEYLENLQSGKDTTAKSCSSNDKVTIPAGLWQERPQDYNARVPVIDTEQGIVVAIGVVEGFVCPYLTSADTGSCFVPAGMIGMHKKTLDVSRYAGRQVIKQLPATGVTAEIVRYHSGKIQGMHRFVNLQAYKGGSPWVNTQSRLNIKGD